MIILPSSLPVRISWQRLPSCWRPAPTSTLRPSAAKRRWWRYWCISHKMLGRVKWTCADLSRIKKTEKQEVVKLNTTFSLPLCLLPFYSVCTWHIIFLNKCCMSFAGVQKRERRRSAPPAGVRSWLQHPVQAQEHSHVFCQAQQQSDGVWPHQGPSQHVSADQSLQPHRTL